MSRHSHKVNRKRTIQSRPGDRVQETESKSRRPPSVAAVQKLLDKRRFSSLRRLVGTIAWIWKAAKEFLRVKIGDKEKWEAERRNLCLAAQEGVHFPNTTIDRLVIYKDQTSGLLMCWQNPDLQ